MADESSISTPQDALAFAYLYSFPLYAYALYVKAFSKPQVNIAYPFRDLATPEDRAVVRPNVDTLYTPLFYDLSQGDLEFVIPEFDDRYWLWPWYDLYGNNFGNVGSLQGFKAGKYLLRYTDDNFGVQTEDVEDGYLAYVNSPTPYGMLLNRILVKSRTPEDLSKVHAYQDLMTFTPRPRKHNTTTSIPPFNLNLLTNPPPPASSAPAEERALYTLNLTALLTPHNPSYVLKDRPWISSALSTAGIHNGTFTQPPNTSLPHAVEAANTLASSSRSAPGLSEPLGNNWTQPAASISGDFKSNYAARMFSAQRGYLILSRDQAAYPGYTIPGSVSGSDRFNVSKTESYILTFSSGPPRLKKSGFWSLTIYGGDQYLIPNGLGRYNLGDRSGLVDGDGKPVQQNGGETEFRILIQAADVTPPAEWVGNWLPGPAGGGTFMISMRFYGAEEVMFDGGWEYPAVRKVEALRE